MVRYKNNHVFISGLPNKIKKTTSEMRPCWLVTNIPIMWLLAFKVEAFGKSQYMIIDKMVEGCLRKYFEDFVVMDQTFVMNDIMKVKNSEREIVDSGLIYSFKF
ncbi:elongation factor Ts, mitochondrial [Trifolium repens]|nr:elongation factor Ts, mitochondrial [Trifolium repens]